MTTVSAHSAPSVSLRFLVIPLVWDIKYLHTFLTKDFSGSHQKLFFCIAREENGIKMTARPSLSASSFVIQNFTQMPKMLKVSSFIKNNFKTFILLGWSLSSKLVRTLELTMRLTTISGRRLEVAL